MRYLFAMGDALQDAVIAPSRTWRSTWWILALVVSTAVPALARADEPAQPAEECESDEASIVPEPLARAWRAEDWERARDPVKIAWFQNPEFVTTTRGEVL